jgi:PEP-CTERM motif
MILRVMKRCFLGLILFLSVTSVASFAATIADGLEQAIADGHWTQNYGQEGYSWFGTAPGNSDPGVFFPPASQTVFGFYAQLSNGQIAQTLNFTPSYAVNAPLIELNGISEGGEPGVNYTMIDTPWGGRMASGTAFLSNAPQGQSTPLFSFALGGTVPNSFAFSVFLNNAAAAPSSLTLSGSNGGSATQSVASLSGLDAFTFNVSNVMPFENFTLSALAQPGQSDIAISGVTFQCFAPVPEPATTVLLLSSLALIGLFATARRLARA